MINVLVNPLTLIQTAGFIGILVIIFAESGLFFGFFLPGDSLLFTAGILASQHLSDVVIFNIWYLIIGASLAAILGDSFGYWFGASVGPRIFTKANSILFKQKYVERAQMFYKKYGGKAIVLARFVPVVRTFTPIMAGVGKMRYRDFITWNIVGGTGWVILLTSLGYFLGNSVPNIDKFILPVVVLIIIISALPIVIEYCRVRGYTKSHSKDLKDHPPFDTTSP
jgi:membrane-associated protein